ncbi:MAG TPA: hypothetical protein VGM01_06475 [Ktedonobacteraceae bacterium]
MTTTNSQLRLSRRGLISIIALVALCMWGALFVFTYFIRPQNLPAILAVFILLSAALLCTCTLLIYLISWAILAARARRPSLTQALREGGLITAWLIFNLLLSTLHSWSIFTMIVSFGIIVVVELLVLGRG